MASLDNNVKVGFCYEINLSEKGTRGKCIQLFVIGIIIMSNCKRDVLVIGFKSLRHSDTP